MTEGFKDQSGHREYATRFIKQRVVDVAPTLDFEQSTSEGKNDKLKPKLLASALAGGVAGAVVDITLFPLDTFKTRLQSEAGFWASGGFKGVYNGILPILLTSAPTSALFFSTYNSLVNVLKTQNSALNPLVYFISASISEIVCSTIRVPIEIIKQRTQTTKTKSYQIAKTVLKTEGVPGLYRGFMSTIMREIPFAAVQFPLWEYMIYQLIIYENGKELTALQTAYCGAASGAIAAAVTTPMDVVKTRIMLAEKSKIDSYKKHLSFNISKEIYRERGIAGLFAGVIPRVLWITLGGFIYFGTYHKAKLICESRWELFTKKIHGVKKEDWATAPNYFDENDENLPFAKEKCNEEPLDAIIKVIDEQDCTDGSQKIIDIALLNPPCDMCDKK